jgi:YidC/Oxa1 family membrane protein insertase
MILAAGSPFDPIYNFFGAILAFFYSIIPNLGVAIILLTVLVMLVMFPLTAKQAKSMLAMQRAQPEIKKLQAKYKNDRAKLNEEMMKFYQENKINPLSGCLPLLVQMPVFLALYRVMRDPYKHIPKSSDLYAFFCTPHTGPKSGQLQLVRCNVPKWNLPNPTHFLGMDLSQHATAVTGGFLDALPYFILVGLVVVTGFLQARQSRRNAPNMNSQMAIVTSVLPVAFGLFSLQFPAGLVLYFLVSNLWRLGQQELIMRKITRPGQAALASAGKKDDEVIDVSGVDTSAFPRAAGGLRKLFQIPGAANGDEPAADAAGNGTENGAKNGAAKPSGGTAGAAKSATAKGSPTKGTSTKGAQTKGTSASSTQGASASGSGASSSSRRRNNKKRKRR